MATACTEIAGVGLEKDIKGNRNKDALSVDDKATLTAASGRRTPRPLRDGSNTAEASGMGQSERRHSRNDSKDGQLSRLYNGSMHGAGSSTDSPRSNPRVPAPMTSEGSGSSDQAVTGTGSPMGLPPYSPFMMFPRGPPIPRWQEGGASGSPAGMPGSPMSPGSVLGHPPFGAGPVGAAPGSPHGLYPHHSSSFLSNSSSTPNAPSPLNPGLDGAANGPPLPPFYMQAAAATAANLGGSGPFGPHMGPGGLGGVGLESSLSNPLGGIPSYLSAYSNSQMGLEQQLSQAAASLGLDGGLPAFGSMPNPGTNAAVAAAIMQQQHMAALRRSFAAQAAFGLPGAGLGPSLHHAAALQHLSAAAASAVPLSHHHPLSRLRQSHSADCSPLEMSHMPPGGRQHSRFKPRRSSEPKVGVDGQPRLNARQRRTLRRAKERALKGLMEASVSLLNVHGVKVDLPQDAHFTAVMAAADKEAEQAEEGGYGSPSDDLAGDRGTPKAGSASSSFSADARGASSKGGAAATAAAAAADAGRSKGADRDCVSTKGRADTQGGGARARELAVAADELETSVRDLAMAAVAAVAAVAEGKDISQAAVAAQQAAAAAVTAASVLPPGYNVPDEERMSEDGGGSQFMGTATGGSNSTHGSLGASYARADLADAPSSRAPDAKPPSGRNGSAGKGSKLPPIGNSGSTTSSASTSSAPPVASSSAAAAGGSPAAAASASKAGIEGLDIDRVIDILNAKGKAGAAEEKLVRDLQIIQSLIGALKAPMPAASSERSSRGGGHRGHGHGHQRRSGSFSAPHSGPPLHHSMSFPH